jgi:hypothetical protein
LDNNTTKVLLAAIPSGAFVIIVALVIFGLSPGDCIEIEAPGGGKVTRCKPISDSVSMISPDQINSLENQIEELKRLQDIQQQQLLTSLKQRDMIDEKYSFMTSPSIFQEKQVQAYEQLRFLSPDEADLLLEQIASDKGEISKLNSVANDLMTGERGFSWEGQWKVTGTIGILDLGYEGQIIFNNDGTYESKGNLDGKHVTGYGTYVIDNKLGTCTLSPYNSEPTQYSFVDIRNNSFVMWSPLDFEKLEFNKITT